MRRASRRPSYRGGLFLCGVLALLGGCTRSNCDPNTGLPVKLVSISVTPSSTTLAAGSKQQYVVTALYNNGTKSDVAAAEIIWSSSNPAAAAIGTTGATAGLVSTQSPGATTIAATYDGLSTSTSLTVTAATLVAIEVSPTHPSIPGGLSQALVATGVYSNGSTQDLTHAVTWSSAAPEVASVSNSAGSQGLVTAQLPGATSITATLGGVFGSTPVASVAATLVSIEISGAGSSLAKGVKAQLTATGVYSDGSRHDLTTSVTWSSTVPQVGTVSAAGLTAAVAPGLTVFSATLGHVSGAKSVAVTLATLVSINVTPADTSSALGLTTQFTATGIYTDNSTQNLTTSAVWSSSSTAVATISNASGSSGLAMTVATGATTVTATDGATAGSTSYTVTAATLQSIQITGGQTSIPNGTTEPLTATGFYSDGTHQDLTASVLWTSSMPAIATVSNAAGSRGLVDGQSLGSTRLSASLGGVSASLMLRVTAATLVSIQVTPPNPGIADGTNQQFTATGTYTDNTTRDLTNSVVWSSSTTATATVSNAYGMNGLATARAVGTTTIAAFLGTVSASTRLNSTAATLVSIAVTPSATSLAAGTSRQFAATGIYSDHTTQDLTSVVTWASSAQSVAQISTAGGTSGLATAHGVGTTNISATLDAISGTTSLGVTAATLVSIALTPASSSIADGTSRQFAATGTYSDGSTQDLTSQVTWSSSSAAVASIGNTAGSYGLATSETSGSTTVSATLGGVSGSAPLAVTAATLVSIAITPNNLTLADGTDRLFTAIGTYSDGSTENLTASVTWNSSVPAVAPISNASGSKALATAEAMGTTTLGAVLGNVSGSTSLTVSAATLVSLAITPPNPSIADGTSEQFTATGTYSDNSTQNLTNDVAWTSSVPATASISSAQGSNGLATGSGVGTTTIGASVGGVSAATGLSVTAATLTSIAVTPTNPSIPNGTGEAFTATGTYSDGTTQDLTAAVSWSSSAPSTATISNASGSNGVATSANQGSATITATLGGVSGSTALTVTAATLVSIGVTPPNPSIANGRAMSLVATGVYSDGTTQNLTASVAWSSSNTAVAAISNAAGSNGLATSNGQGSTAIRAALSGISGSATLTVTPATLVSIGVTPANPNAAKGTTKQFTATGVYSDNSTQNLTTAVTWSSSATGVATISNAASSNGLAAATAVGGTTVTAVLGGLTGSTGFTVSPAALTSIAVTPTNPSVADGLAQQFTATGTYTDNTTQNLTSAATWSSSLPAVAAVSNASGSNGLAATQSVGSTTVSAAIGSISGSSALTVTPASLVSIAVTPKSPSIANGTTEQYVATGTYSDGSTKNLTSTVTWISSSPNTASISNASGSNGLATSAAPGSATITAAIGSVSGSAALTVTPAMLVSIAITPANQNIADGTSQQYTATGTYTDGSMQNLTSAVAWTSSTPSVASISNAAGSQGLASSAAQGTTTLTAGLGSITSTTQLNVTAATLVSIAVTPANATIYVSATQQYVATGTYTDGSTQVLTGAVTWSSSNIANATVSNAADSHGLATGIVAGNVTVTAIAAPGSLSGSTGLTVAPQYAYVTNYGNNTIAEYSIGATGALTATGTAIATGVNPFFVVINAANQYLYEVNISDNSLWQYSIGSGGALSFIQNSATGSTPAELVIDRSGQYVYVENIGSATGTVSEYSIGANGALNPIGSIATGTTAFGIRIDPVNPYLYVSNNGGGISEYAIGANGVLSSIGTEATDSGLDKMAIDPAGKYLYVANSTTNMIEEFQIGANGQLTQIGMVTAGSYPRTIIFDRNGKYVYVTNVHDDSISEYAIGSGGALTLIGTVGAGGTTPAAITLDATGQFAYVTLRDSNSVAEFSVGSDGTLTLLGTIATGSGTAPSGIATIH